MQPCGVYNDSYNKDTAIVRTHLQWTLVVVFLIVLFTAPPFLSRHWVSFLNLTAITLIAVIGVNLLTGYCGQISLGQAAFVAVGAYASAILTVKAGIPFWLALPCAGIAAGIVGLVFALPSVRVKGFYLAMVTLGAQFIIIWVISHAGEFTGGTFGMKVPPANLGPIVFDTEKSCYYLIMTVAIIMALFAKNLARTNVGRSFIAIRDNDLAAEVMGINLFRYKLLAFFICSFYAGVAGSLWAHWLTTISPEQFPLSNSIWYLGMMIVGGMGTALGAILGTVFVQFLNEAVITVSPIIGSAFPLVAATIFASLGSIVFGLVIVLFLIFEPRGLAHRWEIIKHYYRLYPLPY